MSEVSSLVNAGNNVAQFSTEVNTIFTYYQDISTLGGYSL